MGWDAYARNKNGAQLTNKQVAVFQRAHELVELRYGTADPNLKNGGLDWRDCAFMLERALEYFNALENGNAYAYDENGWDSEKVRLANKFAMWKFKVEADEEPIKESARVFLETCASMELEIFFSF